MTTKKDIRTIVRSLTRAASEEDKLSLSESICHTLELSPLFQEAKTVLLFHSLPDEVNTHSLIRRYASSKTILLPAITADSWQLREYRSEADLCEGMYHIMEPVGEVWTDYAKVDLVVVPGVAFTSEGDRVGRGKGYYDRILSTIHARTIAICFPWQLFDALPTDEWDRRVEQVICR